MINLPSVATVTGQPGFRIGYVLKMYPRFSETFVVNEILALEEQGLQMEIFSLRAPNDGYFHETLAEVQAHVTYIDHETPKSSTLWSAFHAAAIDLPGLWSHLAESRHVDVRQAYQAVQLARSAKRLGLHHLHAHFADVASRVTRLAAKMAGITYSFTAHAKDIFHQDVNCNQLQGLIREAAYVITVSDFNRSFLSDMAPDSAAQIHRVYNGLDLRKYPFRPFGDRPESIVAVGRLVEKKGFDVLIEACRLLRDDGIVVPCRIIGVGDQQTALARQVEALSLVDQISFVGALTHARVIEEVSSASLFAAPCVVGADGNRDGLPTVLLEAMALGTPCISTDVTGIPELLDHQRTGLCVPQRDPRALADAIRLLLSDRALASRLATYARERIEQEFDNAVTGRRIAALHGSVAPISTAAYAGAA